MSRSANANTDDVRILGIDQVEIDLEPHLRVRGLLFHSALAVGSFETKREGNAQRLLVTMVPALDGLSGAFSADVPIPPEVERVLFGPLGTTIWKRD